MVNWKKTRKNWGKKMTVSKMVRNVTQRVISKVAEDKMWTGRLPNIMGAITTAWTEVDLCTPAEGLDLTDRIGRGIRIKSIEIKGILACGTAESLLDDPYNIVRAVLGIYTGATSTPLTTAAAANPLQIVLTKNFNTRNYLRKKLFDRFVGLEVTSTEKGGGDGYTPQLKQFKYYKKFKNGLPITWGDSGTNYPDKRIVFSVISDSAAAVNPGFIAGYYAVRYEDF